MRLLFILLLLVIAIYTQSTSYRTRETRGKKGKFFLHTLHSASFFNSTVGVKWSATSKNRPILPQWLKLVKSRYSAIAYLTGTPVTDKRQVLVHVIATRLDSFDSQQQQLVITLDEDDRFNGQTKEILELHLKNKSPEELLTDRTNLIDQLERSISSAFNADKAYPYIYDIAPTIQIQNDANRYIQDMGSIISVGTQKQFSKRLHSFVSSLPTKGDACKKNSMIPVNRYFQPYFTIDWCRTLLKNSTVATLSTVKPAVNIDSQPIYLEGYNTEPPHDPPHQVSSLHSGFTFFEGVLLFPIIAVICIFLVLILSIIFFGKREGQQWRDYKTSKTQLEEFANVRDTQRHLRELSLQRQLLIMSKDDTSVSGVRAFLQPKQPAYKEPKENSELRSSQNVSKSIERIPVGKQTVADAAKQYGGPLHFYKNPFESESDEKSDGETTAVKTQLYYS
ncbi:unnamed protein product [Auanema sp. JU1783]|nr:unnamed protein product [Auanema sp. JU1783]